MINRHLPLDTATLRQKTNETIKERGETPLMVPAPPLLLRIGWYVLLLLLLPSCCCTSCCRSSGHQGPARLHEVADSSTGPQTRQFGRSEAEAKLHLLGLDPDPRTTVASCEAIRGPDHGNLGRLALPARQHSPATYSAGAACSLLARSARAGCASRRPAASSLFSP
jgi:hypothetical protein